MTTGRNPSVPHAMNRSTQEFVRHRIFEYGYRYATLCTNCFSWEIGKKNQCGNAMCGAIGKPIRHLEAQWSNRQVHRDNISALCVMCRDAYIRCSCEWKKKYIAWKKYEASQQRESE